MYVDFTCECVLAPTDPARRLYRVTGHGGDESTCSYCEDCAALAAMDWNGETAAIVAIRPVHPSRQIDETRDDDLYRIDNGMADSWPRSWRS